MSKGLMARLVLWLVLLTLSLGLAALGGAVWVLQTQSGTRFLLQQAPAVLAQYTPHRIQVQGTQGTLWHGLQVEQLEYTDGKTRVLLQGLVMQLVLDGLIHKHLDALQLRARNVEVALPPPKPDDPPFALPQSIPIPLSIHLHQLNIDRLKVGDLVVEQLQGQAKARLGRLNIEQLDARVQGTDLSLLGDVRLAQPYPLDAALTVRRSLDNLDLNALLKATGSLNTLNLDLVAQGTDTQRQRLQQSVNVQAVVTPFEPGLVRQIEAQAQAFNPKLWVDSAPQAELGVQIKLTPNAALTRSEGEVRINNGKPLAWHQGGIPVRDLRAVLDVQLKNTLPHTLDLQLQTLQLAVGNVPQGVLTGTVNWQAAGQQAAPSARNPGNWQVALQGQQLDPKAWTVLPKAQAVNLALKADLAQNTLQVQNLQITQAGDPAVQLSLQGKGQLNANRAMDWALQFANLNPAQYAPKPNPMMEGRLGGTASFKGELGPAGQSLQPKGELTLNLPDGRLAKAPFDVQLNALGDLKRLERVVLNGQVADNHIKLQGAYGGPQDHLDLTLDARQLKNLGQLVGQPMQGTAEVQARLSGQGWGMAGKGQLQVNQLRLADVIKLDQATGSFELGLQAQSPWLLDLQVANLARPVAPNPTQARAAQTAFETLVKQATVQLRGTRAQHRLQAHVDTPLVPFSNRRAVAATVALQGGLNEAAQWQGQLTQLDVQGLWRPVRSFKLAQPSPISVGAQGVDVGLLTLLGEDQSTITSQRFSTLGGQLIAKGQAPRLAVPQLSTVFKAQVSLEPKDLVVRLDWDYKASLDTMDGHVELKHVSGGFRVLEDAEMDVDVQSFDLKADFNRQAAKLQALVDAKNFGQLTANATLPVDQNPDTKAWRVSPYRAMEGAVALSVSDLTWLGPLVQSGLRTTGNSQLALALSGSISQPKVEGRLFARDLVISQVDQGLRLEDGQLVLDFTDDHATVDTLLFNVYHRQAPRNRIEEVGSLISGTGQVSASGRWNLDGLGGEMVVKLLKAPLLQRPDRWMVLDGQITAKQPNQPDDPVLVRGDVQALGGYIEMPEGEPTKLGSDVVVRGRGTASTGKPLPLDIALGARLGKQFYLHAMGLRTRLTGGLNLVVQDGLPATNGRSGRRLLATGSITTADGTYRAYGQDLTIERGVVNFQGPLDNPGLNIRAVRKGVAVEAGVEITGSARRPQVALVSDPAVPDADKLSWMILGRSSNSADKNSALLLTAAAAIFGDDEDSTTRKIARSVGIDDLGFSSGSLTAADSRAVGSRVARAPGADINANVIGADDPLLSQRIISLGKRLNEQVYLGFEQSVTTAASIVKLTYQYSRRMSLIARGGADNAVDVLYQFSFD